MVNKKIGNIVAIVIALPFFFIFFLFINSFVSEVIDDIDSEFEDEDDYAEIVYIIPDEFEEEDYYGSYHYSYSGEEVSCSIYIDESNKWNDFEYWFKGRVNIDLNDKVTELTKTNINDNNVLTVTKISDYDKVFYYGFESTNHYYEFEYKIYDSSHGDNEEAKTSICYTALDKVLSSIEIK